MSLFIYCCAFVLDLILGDPPHWPHPIRWIGTAISRTEKVIRRLSRDERWLYTGGAVLWIVIVAMSWGVTWLIVETASTVHLWLGEIITLWLAYTIFAGRCLADCANVVYQAQGLGNIEESRLQLSYIVGRDTRSLDDTQISRAVVETVAENAVDGVIAPMFYLFLGGVPLAMAYKAINTLDSMVGYKNEKYRALGYVSARMDDLANWLPARLSWVLFSLAALLLRYDAKSALTIGWRDRYQHKSPNCAWPEASVAGALGIQLGGPNDYFGQRVEKPWIGDNKRPLERDDIQRTIRLMYLASILALFVYSGVCLMIGIC
ncbi:adenosylcobinamide-phosphate synthase CbiB [Vibrio mangrovi]|uniref:Cobalamin biosynthesis protein CobD n=1 Tax=Vibrio mangrovi TaxID=474394 RepID=A0A1Y6IXV7_9VIBR|nr:adenosylcobinamide-phosphate synthase CbiB [Vibrio mangrovi]MDW6004584.1 adenosylcobinamide-phosphate synthase CbiB [Vibrio mangrovi]SMS00873.1 cobalamin biosynthesis protein [Vibrio mangrovi]